MSQKLTIKTSIAQDSTANSLRIYSHNVGGAKSKIYTINDKLSTTAFEILCLQETWYDDKVGSSEIIASANFALVRNDRSCLESRKKSGGGLATFIMNDLNFKQISLNITTIQL